MDRIARFSGIFLTLARFHCAYVSVLGYSRVAIFLHFRRNNSGLTCTHTLEHYHRYTIFPTCVVTFLRAFHSLTCGGVTFRDLSRVRSDFLWTLHSLSRV